MSAAAPAAITRNPDASKLHTAVIPLGSATEILKCERIVTECDEGPQIQLKWDGHTITFVKQLRNAVMGRVWAAILHDTSTVVHVGSESGLEGECA